MTTRMWIVMVGASLALGCTSSGPTEVFEASAAAREFGVAGYSVQESGSEVTVQLLDEAGAELGELQVSRVGSLIPAVTTVDGEELTAHYKFHLRYEGIGEKAPVTLDGDTHAGKIVRTANRPWLAVVTDPALADSLARLDLTWRVGMPPGFEADFQPVDESARDESAYSGEYPCCGHRVNADGHYPGFQYLGCWSSGDCGTQQLDWMPYNTCGTYGYFWDHLLLRYCNPGCCNGSCSNPDTGPSPCGPPYGNAGCYTSGDHWDYYDYSCE